ncbi:DUF86 domain-containing protein [Candidatus Peregrinibacteria bacterium]|nr:DUF86 domain-containing protein [Candidatus Peregrinibacteria bacterium]
MPDKNLLNRKITEILKQLEHLKILLKLKSVELFDRANNFYFAERVMERMIGAAIDMNMHIVADLGGEVPKDYHSSFIDLAKYKILPLAFAKRIALSTTLRNLLVHEYQSMDEGKFKQALKFGFQDYKKYLEYIEKWLRKF